jgi:hypothetical protein
MGKFDSLFAELDDSPSVSSTPEKSKFADLFADLEESYSGIRAQEEYKAKGEAERGFLGDTASHLARGGIGLLESTARGIETVTGSETANKVGDYFRDLPQETAFLRPDESEVRGDEGIIKRGWNSAGESLPESMAIIPAAMAGAAAGTAVLPGVGTAIGGVIGGGAALLGLFGAGTYGKQKDAVDRELALTRPELTPEQREDIADKNALTHAYAEVGGEGVGDAAAFLIFKAVPGGGALYKGGKQILKELAAPGAMKTIGMGLLKDAPFEVGSEVGTSYFQNEADIEAGISKTTTADAMKESIVPALFLTTGMGVTLGGMSAIERQRAYSQINEGTAEERQKRVQLLAGNLQQATDSQVAKTWYDTAMSYVSAGDAIPLDVNVAELAARKPDPVNQPAEETVKPDLNKEHTVNDVLARHKAKVAAEAAEAFDLINNSGPVIDPAMLANTVGGVLGGTVGQPATTTNSNRLDFYLKSMAKSLYPEPGAEGPHENPVWIKKKTLENWEKETGEDIKSFVHSGSAKETLAAVIAGKPLSDKQAQVWGYLKSVAENMAMVDEQTALDDVHSVSGNEKPLSPTGTGELPADFGGEAVVPQTLSSEETSLTKIYQDHGAKVAKEVSNAWRQGEKISLEEAKKRVAVISEVEPGTSLATNAEDAGISADEERFTDMVKVLNSQSSAEDLDATAKDMAGIFKVRPELAPYQDRFNAARDEAAKKFTGGQNEKAQGSSVGGGNVQQGSKEEVATTYPEQNNQDTPAEPIPNADRHEVIQNAESVAVGQSVNVAPSEAQAEAGNYKKAHVKIDGLDISIENPSGSTRSGTDKTGNSWQTEMKADYGYIKGSKGYDKDHVDVFMSPGYQGGAETAYVVDQYNDDGSFDEHKIIFGATSEADAMAIYKSNYAAGWTGGKAVSPMPMAEFKEWAKSDAPKSGPVGKAKETFAPERVNLNAERVNLNEAQAASSSGPEIIEHVTKQGKGKTITGIVRKDITKAEAKAIDPYTFPKDGGFFIREKYLTEDDKAGTGKAHTSDVSINEKKPAIDTKESTGEGISEKEGLSSPPSTDAPVVDNPVPERPIEDFTLESAQELYAQLKEKEREQGTVVDDRLVSRMKQFLVLIKQLQADKDSLTVPGSKEKAVPEVPSTETEPVPSPLKQEVEKAKEKKETVAPSAAVPAETPPLAAKTEPENTTTASESPDRFAGNKVFTGDMVKDALARLKARQNTLNSGFNPLDAQDMFIIGGAYFESGVRKFTDWAKEVTAAVGKDLAIYLPDVYSMIRKTPGIETDGISSQEEVDAELNKPAPEETPTPLKEEIEKAKTKPLLAELEKLDAKIEELYQLRECLKS